MILVNTSRTLELHDLNLIADFTCDVAFFVAPSLDTLSMSKLHKTHKIETVLVRQ